VLGTDSIYTHFMYVAIALACMWWGFRGLAVAGLLGAMVLSFNLFWPSAAGTEAAIAAHPAAGALFGPPIAGFTAEPLVRDAARAAFFLAVGFFIALLRRRLTAGQEALRQSEESHRRLLEQSLSGICVFRGDSILYANQRLCVLLGYAPENLVGASVWRLFHEGDRERARGALGPGAECRLLRADNTVLWVEGARASTVFQGREAELLNLYDITQRKDAESSGRELAELARRQEEQLEHSTRLAELGEMAAAISHELNQPLTGIRNYARNSFYMLDKQAGSPEEIKENLRLISEQVDRAAKIINQMRELTRRSDRNFTGLDLNSVIRESVEFLLPQMKLSKVQVTLSLAEELPPIRGDRIRLAQVFLNLLTNARQAMEESRVRELAVRTYLAARQDLCVVAQIADTGKGFSAEQAPKLFVPFYTTKARGQGTGLGLSISRSIVQAHHGTIEASGLPGRGATFMLRFPASGPEEQKAAGS
jgi:PAS domain S-box-containing protein